MDTFIDRLSHRRNSQEMIQANSAAEAAKMERLQRQIDEYNNLLQDMRKVNLKAVENMEQMQKVLKESFEKIEAVKEQEDLMPDIKKQMDELVRQGQDAHEQKDAVLVEMKSQMDKLLSQIKFQLEEAMPRIDEQMEEVVPQIKEQMDEILNQIKSEMQESFKQSDDFLHRENVKVYRNVQAAMTEEINRQTGILVQEQEEKNKKLKPLLPISIIIMLMVIADIVINLLGIVIKF